MECVNHSKNSKKWLKEDGKEEMEVDNSKEKVKEEEEKQNNKKNKKRRRRRQ